MTGKYIDLCLQLKTCGYKLTKQRQEIFDVLFVNKDKHLNGNEIFNLVKKNYENIGLSTIYRTLLLFQNCQIVSAINTDDGSARYQLVNPKEKHQHHHLICMQCGKIIDINADLLEELEHQVYINEGFKVMDHRVKLLGTCSSCI